MPEAIQKHLKIIAYLIGSGLCAIALIHLIDAPSEYALLLTPTINYVAYALELELRGEGVIRHE
jgi:hypothetical protein